VRITDPTYGEVNGGNYNTDVWEVSMPLGNLGSCSSDILQAEAEIRQYTAEYCRIINGRPQPVGLPPYIQPPKNAVRWQPGKDATLTIPVAPAGVDQLVFSDRMPLGYDGLIVLLSNVWNGTGFVEGSGDITWRVKLDRRFIPDYDTILVSLSNLSVTAGEIVGQGIPVYSGQLVQYFVNFAAGSENRLNPGGKTLCAISGYKWPRERLV